MDYKFVDIGTSYFCTSIDEFGLDVHGILVEPVAEYLNIIPSSHTIIKANYAISDSQRKDILYIPIMEHELKYYSEEEILKSPIAGLIGKDGCGSLGKPHPEVPRNYKTIECKVITFYDLCKKYNINSIEYLKIDAEGQDYIILEQVRNMMLYNQLEIKKRIMFEYNHLANKPVLDDLCNKIEKEFDFSKKISISIWGQEEIILQKKRSR